MQGEFADLGQQGLLTSLKLLREIARMTAQSLGALGDEVVVASLRSAPLLDLGESERVLTSGLRSGGLALEDVDDEGGLALGCSALWAVGIGLDVDSGRCGGGFGLTHGRDFHVEGER